ncbi:hypothetical protein FSP39_004092 [Pinctada imbricata]|uniref:Uncharacterized protein n=1 Tax=Pinctada imbricata TaxID=66713 RepID=A0AA89BK65_PINIB|nr:hypothetical protein FSP39_004092 [Pinctada imbricata]
MAESSKQHGISLISKGLYRILSDVLGAECIVKLRRQQWDTVNLLNSCDTSDSYRITSGSRLEGFDFKSSDVDTMHIARNVSVLTKPTCFYAQQLQSPSIFVMENEDCSPGFTLIRCLTCDTDNEILYSSLVWKRNYMYLSSSAIVQTFLDSSIREVHGPCKAGNLLGIDADHAYTLKCPVWPRKTTPFVNRSIKQGWPPNDVLRYPMYNRAFFNAW